MKDLKGQVKNSEKLSQEELLLGNRVSKLKNRFRRGGRQRKDLFLKQVE